MDAPEIKKALFRTWMPFFGHFGRFTLVQELAIPAILAKSNVVVISPAATGKTEAVVAPVLENLFEKGIFRDDSPKLRVLYISPTRALVNDLYRRLEDPVRYLGVSLGVKTGDRPQLTSMNLPHILITTPESFDSLLTRRPKIFLDLQTVILDEIHLLDNTPRGDQLRILLNRLRKIRDRLQYCALSATIDDLNIGQRYFPEPKVVFSKAPREIEYSLIPDRDFVRTFLKIVAEKGFQKILIFFNARSLAELFSRKIDRPPFVGLVHVHHASLPKTRREEVEKTMNESARAILCATSTLELGIDIGSMDCIVLYRPPFNVSSLLQRIGRGNRRADKLYAIGVYTSSWEKLLFNTYFECALQGQLFEKRYLPSLSVIPQQIYSYLYQRRRIGTTMNSLCSILSPVYDDDTVKEIFKYTYEARRVTETRPGIYFDSSQLEKQIARGKIHSNIAETSFGEYDVFNVAQGNRIGRIFHLREKFVLGGRCWQITDIVEKEKKVYARCIGDAPAVTKIFEGKGTGSYYYKLAPVIKQRLLPELAPNEFPYTLEAEKTHLLHLFGTLYGSLWADALFAEDIEAMDVEGTILVLEKFRSANDRMPVPGTKAIKRVIGQNISRLEDALGSGAYFYDLPPEYQVEDHFLNLDVDGFLDFLRSLTLVNIDLVRFKQIAGFLR
jgi:ATP-dependent Lhr-like helicase